MGAPFGSKERGRYICLTATTAAAKERCNYEQYEESAGQVHGLCMWGGWFGVGMRTLLWV